MHALTDNLLAVLLTGGLVLMLATVTLRQQEEAGSITNRRAVSGRMAALVSTVQADFSNVAAFQSVTDSTVSFAVTSDPATMAQSTVTYHRARRIVDGETRYDVWRTEDGTSGVVGPDLVDWEVQVRDSSGSVTASLADVERASVRFAQSPTLSAFDDSLDVVWERTFAPPLLGSLSF